MLVMECWLWIVACGSLIGDRGLERQFGLVMWITATACGSVLLGFDGSGAYDGVLTKISGLERHSSSSPSPPLHMDHWCGSVLLGFDGYGACDGMLTEISGLERCSSPLPSPPLHVDWWCGSVLLVFDGYGALWWSVDREQWIGEAFITVAITAAACGSVLLGFDGDVDLTMRERRRKRSRAVNEPNFVEYCTFELGSSIKIKCSNLAWAWDKPKAMFEL